jgi:hypothetical protein
MKLSNENSMCSSQNLSQAPLKSKLKALSLVLTFKMMYFEVVWEQT